MSGPRFLQAFAQYGAVEKLWKRSRYPGLGMANGVNFDIRGSFQYGPGCSVGEGANLIVPQGAILQLGTDSYVGRYAELGPAGLIRIGDDASVQDRCTLLGDVSIGRHCRLAPNVWLSSGRHYFDLQPHWLIRDQDEFVRRDAALSAQHSKPIVVEDDCWLGINSVVLPGVTIGRGSIIGAGAVVAGDVAPYSIMVGAPARQVRTRLTFQPPQRIVATEPQHWPYFYGGFDLTQASIARHAAQRALLARGELALALDQTGATRLHLRARALDGVAQAIRFAGQSQPLGTSEQELQWSLSEVVSDTANLQSQSSTPIALRGVVEPRTAAVLISEAWVS